MSKFKFYFILLIATIFLFSCSKDDSNVEEVPLRDFTEQYQKDIVTIETYLKANYITITDAPGLQEDQDVKIEAITDPATQPSIWSYKDNAIDGSTTYPQLWSRNVDFHGITYVLYYLVLREGKANPSDITLVGGGESPCNLDNVLTSYRGTYLVSSTAADVTSVTATFFEENKNPQKMFSLLETVRGWGETFPQFKTGNYKKDGNPDGTLTYNDFGSGIMFLPSGLGYYNSAEGIIPSYSPLVFSFKLYEISRADFDGDGVLSYQEDNGDGYMYDYRNTINYPTPPTTNPDDTDADGIPDFSDIDDDGDLFSTKIEIRNDAGVTYPFDGIPSCDKNTTDPNRKKRHLDNSCFPPYN